MTRKKKIVSVFIVLIIAAALVLVWGYIFAPGQEFPQIEIESRFVLNAEEEPEVPEVRFSSEVDEFAEMEIDLVELRRLKEDLVREDAESEEEDNPHWVELDEYDLPEDLFDIRDEDLGFFDSTYNLKAGFVPTISEYDCQKGAIIGIANVSSSNLKTVFGKDPQRRSYISIVEYLGLTREGLPQPFVYLQLTNKDVFTVVFHPDQDAVKLETRNSGLHVEEVSMGIGLRDKEFYRSSQIYIIVPLHSGRNMGTYLGGDTSVKGYNNITEALNKKAITKLGRLEGFGLPPHKYKTQKYFGVTTEEESKKEERIRLVEDEERILLLGQRSEYSHAPVDMFLEFSFSPGI